MSEQTASANPVRYFDENGVERMAMKPGSARTPGGEQPHVLLRNDQGHRVDPSGELVRRESPGNHNPIEWDLDEPQPDSPPYWSIPALADVVLEESWALGINVRPSQVAFKMSLVMTTDHPDYRPATVDEQWAMIPGLLIFSDVTEVHWSEQGAPPARDADDELDYGNIDSMSHSGGVFRLGGSWGALEFTAESVRISY